MFELHHPLVWGGFAAAILALLAIDIGVFHRRAHTTTMREATLWTVVWISLASSFGVLVYLWLGARPAIEYATGYLLELSLSVDNLFVIAVILGSLGVPQIYHHRVLFWGIIGALVMRAIFIFAGSALLHAFHWSIYLFGGLLLFAAWRLFRETGQHARPGGSRVLVWMARVIPMTPHFHGSAFFIKRNGRRVATALFAALVLVEASDLMFAIDSVPAILAVTRDPFLVFASNAFAVLGLRSLYFVLNGVLERFSYLKYGLALILGFVGLKLIGSDVVHLPVWSSLLVMFLALGGAILLSVLRPSRIGEPAPTLNEA